MDTISPTVTSKKITTIEPEWANWRVVHARFGWSKQTIYKKHALGLIEMRKDGPNKTLISIQSCRDHIKSLPLVQASVPKPRPKPQKPDAPPRRRGRPRKQPESVLPAAE
jgi:hypothetical protein